MDLVVMLDPDNNGLLPGGKKGWWNWLIYTSYGMDGVTNGQTLLYSYCITKSLFNKLAIGQHYVDNIFKCIFQ